MGGKSSTIKKEKFTYGDGKYKGFIAYDTTKEGKKPGILIIHEASGIGEYTESRAVQLAELGYVGFAIDMVGGGKRFCGIHEADSSLEKFDEVLTKFNAAHDYLKQHPQVDPNNIAAIGYCYGGIVVLNVIKKGSDMKGVASFHGGLKPYLKAEKGIYKGKVLVCHGEADTTIKPEEVEEFKKEFNEAEINYKFIGYPGAKHAFTNPKATFIGKRFGLPFAYDEKADKESWAELQTFLKDIFSS